MASIIYRKEGRERRIWFPLASARDRRTEKERGREISSFVRWLPAPFARKKAPPTRNDSALGSVNELCLLSVKSLRRKDVNLQVAVDQ